METASADPLNHGYDPEGEMETPPRCPTCGDAMLDDSDGITGGWICANGHRGEVVFQSAAPGTEPPRELRTSDRWRWAAWGVGVGFVVGVVAALGLS